MGLLPQLALTAKAADAGISLSSLNGSLPQDDTTYSISSAAELALLADIVNEANDYSGNSRTCSSVTFVLTADIALGCWTDDGDGTV